MRRLTVIIAMILAGLVTATGLVVRAGGRSNHPPLAVSDPADRSAAGFAVASALPAPALRRRAPPAFTAPVEPAAPLAAATAPADPPPGTADYRARLETRLHGQAVNPKWSGRATEQLRQGLEALLGTRGRIESVDCRASLCEARLALADEPAYDDVLHDSVRVKLWPGPFYVSRTPPGGAANMVMIFGRDGTDLPSDGY